MAANGLENNEKQERQQRSTLRQSKFFIIIIGVIIVSVTAGALLFMWWNSWVPGKAQNKAILYELGEFTTNLAPDSNKRFVQVKIVLELEQAAWEKEVTKKAPILHDCVLAFFNGKNSEALKAENRDQLKKELITQMNNCLQDGKISNIYFSILVMQ